MGKIEIGEVHRVIKQAGGCLIGSPYSFPTDIPGLQRLEVIGESLLKIQRSLPALSGIENLSKPMKRILRTREVFESNDLEGVGPGGLATSKILDSHEVNPSWIEWVVTQGIKNDRQTFDVLGLAAALELSRNYANDPTRSITESDIRTLHGIILQGQFGAGEYKLYDNWIEGNDEHKTASPDDTRLQMTEFCNWMNQLPRRGFRTLESIVMAAAVHSWLVHIHPFTDGNGRTARLLTNMILAREGMFPLILRAKADRTQYIDALKFSDEAGDISRLILLICRSEERLIDDVSDPQLAEEYFKNDIDLRMGGEYGYWKSFIDEWTTYAMTQLKLRNLSAEKIGELRPSDFQALRKLKSANRAWYLKVTTADKKKVIGIWFFGYLPGWTLAKLSDDKHYPCLLFLVPNEDPHPIKPFIQPRRIGIKVVTGLMIEPAERAAYVWGDQFDAIRKVSLKEAAEHFAHACFEFS